MEYLFMAQKKLQTQSTQTDGHWLVTTLICSTILGVQLFGQNVKAAANESVPSQNQQDAGQTMAYQPDVCLLNGNDSLGNTNTSASSGITDSQTITSEAINPQSQSVNFNDSSTSTSYDDIDTISTSTITSQLSAQTSDFNQQLINTDKLQVSTTDNITANNPFSFSQPDEQMLDNIKSQVISIAQNAGIEDQLQFAIDNIQQTIIDTNGQPTGNQNLDMLLKQFQTLNAQQDVMISMALGLTKINWWDAITNIVGGLAPALLMPLNIFNPQDSSDQSPAIPVKDTFFQLIPTIIDNIVNQGTQSIMSLTEVNTKIVDDARPMGNLLYSRGYVQKNTPVYVDSSSDAILGKIDDYNVAITSIGAKQNGRIPFQYANNIGWVNEQATTRSRQVYDDDFNWTHFTRDDMSSIAENVNNPKYQAPRPVDQTLNQELKGAIQRSSLLGRQEALEVWDSWPVQNTDGTLANYHGYHLVIGLTAPKGGISAKMGLFSQPINGSQTGVNSWTYLGNLFNQFGEGAVANDPYLKYMQAEWSGSTVMLNPNDDTLRVFYTNHTHLMTPGGQVLTTAQISVEAKDNDWANGLVINHSKTTDHRSLYAGDGKLYQNQQNMAGFAGSVWDDYCLRDPHLVADHNQYYLVFEGNTGTQTGNQGLDNFYNQAYYSKDRDTFLKERQRLIDSVGTNEYQQTYMANAAIGIMSLNPDFTVKEVMNPLVTANAANDELERPNLVHFQNKWYLFSDTRGSHMASTDLLVHGNDQNNYPIYMLGFVSEDGINGHYKPLNGNGLVLVSNIPQDSPDFTYAHYVIPNQDPNSNEFVVTAYLNHKTFAPSLLLKIDGDSTTMVTDQVLGQGDVVVTPTRYSTYLSDQNSQSDFGLNLLPNRIFESMLSALSHPTDQSVDNSSISATSQHSATSQSQENSLAAMNSQSQSLSTALPQAGLLANHDYTWSAFWTTLVGLTSFGNN
ncbi:glycoside hydrolase family 68 protein [Convivina praedatoris]|nr:glycoside hydrolase family 68 protein [Convivina sp. LMG 32447]